MEYLIPVVIVVAIAIVFLVVARVVAGRRKQEPAASGSASSFSGTAPEASVATDASAKLTVDQHRKIYSMIAQGQHISAIKGYRTATGCKLREAVAAVAALEAHPQPSPTQAAPPVEATRISAATTASAPSYRYRAIVSKGHQVREISSTRLNDEIYGQVTELALALDYDGAATLLSQHADVSLTEAREFVTFITIEPPSV